MIRSILRLAILFPVAACAQERIPIQVDGKPLVVYQAEPLPGPKGGEPYQGSNFIHPLKTPSGFPVTQSQPDDHLHHFGLWWPWKYIEIENRKVLCWELQKGDGLIQAKESSLTKDGVVGHSEYIDRKAPGGPVPLLHETTTITPSGIVDQPARGYLLDLTIIHRTVGNRPITVTPYRYSGFSIRATPLWNKDNSTIPTSEQMDRDHANFTAARWVRIQGDTDSGSTAGVVLMSHPGNHGHPEKLRTWDKQHNGAVFINFNPVMDHPWIFEPGKDYTRTYRLFVYDGAVSATDAEELWEAYSKIPRR